MFKRYTLTRESMAELLRRAVWSIVAPAFFVANVTVVQSQETPSAPVSSSTLAIDEGRFVKINGVEQWITIRGTDTRNPVLLILHGGPGLPMSGLAPLFSSWEKNYTVVQWDQPGGGATYKKNMSSGIGDLSMNRFVRDGISVTEFVRDRLSAHKVILFGVSGGTSIGLNMVSSRPELFSAYVGTGQMINQRRSDTLSYQLVLDAARKRDDKAAIAELEGIGPPPYKSFEAWVAKQKHAMSGVAEQAAQASIIKSMSMPPAPDATYIAKGLPSYNGEAVFLDVQKSLFDSPVQFDARALGKKFDVPMFFFQGAEDVNTVTSLVTDFYSEIQAPQKRLVLMKDVGHNTLGAHEELLRLLDTNVRPIAVRAH